MRHTFQTRPLYMQVRDEIVDRIRGKAWPTGEALPNEFALAEEFGVSQGTVRKALSVLERDRLVRRVQGRGTFATPVDPSEIASRFYRLRNLDGDAKCVEKSLEIAPPAECERERLKMKPGQNVIRITRLRLMGDRPVIKEICILPQHIFPSLAERKNFDVLLISCFEESGIIAHSATEHIMATVADKELAEELHMDCGAPILKTVRVVYDADEKPFELRVRYCNLGDAYYEAELS